MKSRWKRSLTALVLAACVILAWPLYSNAAPAPGDPVDVNEKCSLTVTPGSKEEMEDLVKANLVFDLYKVADAVADKKYDTYEYRALPDYAKVEGLAQSHEELVKMENEKWRALAENVAVRTFAEPGKITPVEIGITVTEDGKLATGRTLGSGLYLLIARTSSLTDPADYLTTMTDEDGTVKHVTRGYTSFYEYSFLPELISLPGKSNVDSTLGGIATSSPGDWEYDYAVQLKPEREPRYGNLEITKTLRSYETGSSAATFVFQVEASWTEGGVPGTYSNVVGLTFNAAGTRTARIDGKIPIGATVTVTEVYSGSSYTQTGEVTLTPVDATASSPASVTFVLQDDDNLIQAVDVVSAGFENDYNENNRKGYGIINHFTKSGDDANTNWQWSNTGDSSTQNTPTE